MKTTFNTLCAIILVSNLSAQGDVTSDLFSDYDHREDVTRISVSGNMFKMMGQTEDKDDENSLAYLADQITGLKVIVDSEDPDASGTMDRASERLSKVLDPMMSVRDKKDRMEMFISEKNGVAENLVITAAHDEHFVIVNISGHIKLEDISNMSNSVMNTVHGSNFRGAKVEHSDFKLFPNPVRKGGTCTLSIPDDMLGARLSIHDGSGKTRHTEYVNSIEKPLNLSKLNAGTYVVRMGKNQTEVAKKLVIQ